jgi:hypothetical protein
MESPRLLPDSERRAEGPRQSRLKEAAQTEWASARNVLEGTGPPTVRLT